jgi:hypothetical protein
MFSPMSRGWADDRPKYGIVAASIRQDDIDELPLATYEILDTKCIEPVGLTKLAPEKGLRVAFELDPSFRRGLQR